MNQKKWFALVMVVILILSLAGCTMKDPTTRQPATPPEHQGVIYLYGEIHSQPKILDRELELWKDHYLQGLRHLFVEYPYYTGELLNLWMKSEDDRLLDDIYADWAGTLSQSVANKAFLQAIKKDCPETVFHGTDVGHQYDTTGERYLRYLEKLGQKGSLSYTLALENIRQGQYYYNKNDQVYRENKMTENFIRAFDELQDESIMGIYGVAHCGLDAMDSETGSVPCMTNQLHQHYGELIRTEDLSYLAKQIEPLAKESMEVDGKKYTALYFGEEDLSSWTKEYKSRKFWRLENAYEDFKDNNTTGDVLPFNNYPMNIHIGEIFVIDYLTVNGETQRKYYCSNGGFWKDLPATVEIEIKKETTP